MRVSSQPAGDSTNRLYQPDECSLVLPARILLQKPVRGAMCEQVGPQHTRKRDGRGNGEDSRLFGGFQHVWAR